uniref:Ovule protein n=1 Tax=Ascaris lumbricoides TaxID=6252 RepID=A0A0M3HJK8_ASCLU
KNSKIIKFHILQSEIFFGNHFSRFFENLLFVSKFEKKLRLHRVSLRYRNISKHYNLRNPSFTEYTNEAHALTEQHLQMDCGINKAPTPNSECENHKSRFTLNRMSIPRDLIRIGLNKHTNTVPTRRTSRNQTELTIFMSKSVGGM